MGTSLTYSVPVKQRYDKEASRCIRGCSRIALEFVGQPPSAVLDNFAQPRAAVPQVILGQPLSAESCSSAGRGELLRPEFRDTRFADIQRPQMGESLEMFHGGVGDERLAQFQPGETVQAGQVRKASSSTPVSLSRSTPRRSGRADARVPRRSAECPAR